MTIGLNILVAIMIAFLWKVGLQEIAIGAIVLLLLDQTDRILNKLGRTQ